MTDFAERRRVMVDTQVRPQDVTKFPIIDAMLNVPREHFVPDSRREAAYVGQHTELDGNRVVLEPRTFSKMLDALEFNGDELVLDVGAGLGYSSAVIARMTQAVVALEENEDWARELPEILSASGTDNVIVQAGPLREGAAEHGPFDAIIVEGGVETLPDALVEQLKPGGKIACVFMEGAVGVVRTGLKLQGGMSWRFEFNADAPVLPGFEKKHDFSL
jgi:protein-L-isoaspartate(D-aspartate) O-methyltransferase